MINKKFEINLFSDDFSDGLATLATAELGYSMGAYLGLGVLSLVKRV